MRAYKGVNEHRSEEKKKNVVETRGNEWSEKKENN